MWVKKVKNLFENVCNIMKMTEWVGVKSINMNCLVDINSINKTAKLMSLLPK